MGNQVVKNPIELEPTPTSKELAEIVIDTSVEKKQVDLTGLSDQQLAEFLVDVTEELSRRVLKQQTDPSKILLQHLITASRGSSAAMLEILRDTANHLGVDRRVIQEASPQEPGMMKKLLKKTLSMFSAAVSVTREQITFSRIFNAYTLYRYGVTPYLIKAAAVNTGLSLMGIASGTVAIGLTTRFLYIHPEILETLSKLENPDILGNLDFFVLLSAARDALTHELRYMLEEGLKLTHLRGDREAFWPFLVSGASYFGWACACMKFAMYSNMTDITKAFVFWVEQKTELFSYISKAATYVMTKASEAKEYVVEKAVQAKEFVEQKAAQAKAYLEAARDRVYEAAAESKWREQMIDYGQQRIRSVLSWWKGKADEATLEMGAVGREMDHFIPERMDLGDAVDIPEPGAYILQHQPQISSMNRIGYTGRKK